MFIEQYKGIGGSEKIDILGNILKYFLQIFTRKPSKTHSRGGGQEKALGSLKIATAVLKVSKAWEKEENSVETLFR